MLVVLIIDEAHTFFVEVKGNDQESKKLTALASENRRLVEDLVKKGRSLGFLTILATQKSTGDSIPASIRDVCPVLMSFAQTTSVAAVAALGEVVRDYPEADPVELQGPEFVGVASMKVEGRKRLTRVRMPYVQDNDVARVAAQNAALTPRPRRAAPGPSERRRGTAGGMTGPLPPEALDAAHRAAENAPPLSDRQRALIRALVAPLLEHRHRGQGAA
jgi:DNA segregation ATPase FtsK/SpoIIIE-like protein